MNGYNILVNCVLFFFHLVKKKKYFSYLKKKTAFYIKHKLAPEKHHYRII